MNIFHKQCESILYFLDSHFDIHTGVINFEFLRCGTEISHLESTNPWFSYFHRGWHVNIPKCKMSKSPTNFTTFEQALEGEGGVRI